MANEMVLMPVSELTALIENSIQKTLKDVSLNNDALLSSEDIRDLFKISDVTLCKWRRQGKIPFTRIDNKIFYRKAEVMASLK